MFNTPWSLYSENQSRKTQQEGAKLDRDPLRVASVAHITIPYLSLFLLLTVMSVRITEIDSLPIIHLQLVPKT